MWSSTLCEYFKMEDKTVNFLDIFIYKDTLHDLETVVAVVSMNYYGCFFHYRFRSDQGYIDLWKLIHQSTLAEFGKE